ncbi:HEAT repeat domain-containing protein [Naasia sp. SYSU D00057]|uniref:HEAT repeat domain-containing protein n=1 Tax=Naasia sp. SYSU D00057 TaxID=2817380 RepID=UPI001B3157FD|nr:HEAT repeat domain-containing protein [Naasia sp. SYSU D00057]
MNSTTRRPESAALLAALAHPSPSTRLRAALAAGTSADPLLLDALLLRCRTEPDFFVRDMLTWAIARLPSAITLPKLLDELRIGSVQATSQALHTLSKIGDRRAWLAITPALLTAAEDGVARSAWRAAVVLVPEEERGELAAILATELGRGDRELQLSLTRALLALGDVVASVLDGAIADPRPAVRAHALATERLLQDPDAGFDPGIREAKGRAAGGPERKESHADR